MDQAREAYRRDGFVVVPGFFAAPEIERVLHNAEAVFDIQLSKFRSLAEFERWTFLEKMQLLLRLDVPSYLAAARTVAKLQTTQRFCTQDRTSEFLATTLGLTLQTISAEPVFHINSEKLKIPGGYFGFDAHQDWTAIQGSLDAVVCWIPLTPVTSTTFPLLVIPGSHKKGLCSGEIGQNVYKVDEQNFSESDFVPAIVNPGDLVVMSVWTIHKTGVEGCSGFRLSVSNRWENLMEKTFSARNFPCAYVKSVRRDFILPDFPSLEQVQSQFEADH